MDRAPSLDARAAVARERHEWHASLSSLLEGDFAREDWELAVSLARSRAQDLTEQLIFWQTPPEPTWPAREQRLDWLEFALSEARDIATSLRQHGALSGVVARRGGGSRGGAAAAASEGTENDASGDATALRSLPGSPTFLSFAGSGAPAAATAPAVSAAAASAATSSSSSFGPPEGVQAYVDIVRGVAAELAGMASLCCDAVAEGLQRLSPGSPDTRRALRAGARAIDVVTALATRLRGLDRLALGRRGASIEEGTGLPTAVTGGIGGRCGSGGSDELLAPSTTAATATAAASVPPSDIAGLVSDLGAVCARVALAALDAAGEAQATLLTPSALRPPRDSGGEAAACEGGGAEAGQPPHLSAHEISVLARTVQTLWTGAGELVEAVLLAWPEQRAELTRDWLVLFLGAAAAATAMQRSGGGARGTGAQGSGRGGIVVALFEDSCGDKNASARRDAIMVQNATTTTTTTGGTTSVVESVPTSDISSDDDDHHLHLDDHSSHTLPTSRGGTPRRAWASVVADGGGGGGGDRERERDDNESSAMSAPRTGGSGGSSSQNKRAAAADASTAATLAAAAARAAAAAAAPRDEDLQAQAWIPSCLTALLASAEHAAAAALEGNAGGSGSGREKGSSASAHPQPQPPPPGIEALAERLSDAMYDLAFVSARRVARLCSAAGPTAAGNRGGNGNDAADTSATTSRLACWALELLEEQATAALVFVRDLDVSVLGRGANALRLYSMLRSAADSLVNAILRCRRALKAKRAAMEAAAQVAVAGGGTSVLAPGSSAASFLASSSDSRGPDSVVTAAAAAAAADAVACESGMPRPLALTRHTSEAGTDKQQQQADAELKPPPPPRPPLPQPVLSPFEAAQNLPIAGWGDDKESEEEEEEEDEKKKKKEEKGTTTAAFAKTPAAHSSSRRVGSLSTTVASEEEEAGAERGGRVPSRQQSQEQQLQQARPPRKSWHERLIGGAVAAVAAAAATRKGGGRSSSRSRSGQRSAGGDWRSASTSRERGARYTDGNGEEEEEQEEPLDVPPRREQQGLVLDEGDEEAPDDDDDDPPLPWHGDPFWEVSWDSLRPTLVRKIGQGSFGQVYEATRHFAPVAVKVMTLAAEDGPPDPAVLRRFKEEVDLQRRLSMHPSIVRFLGACYDVPSSRKKKKKKNAAAAGALASASSAGGTGRGVTLAILMELCRLGNLFKLLEYARRVERLPSGVRSGALPPTTPEQARAKASPGWRLYHSWTTRLSIAQQVAAALAWMHSQRVIHRDMKSSNCLIRHDWAAKVADFNLSRVFGAGSLGLVQHSGAITSPEWAAPERLAGRPYGPPSDVFSFGVVLYELCTLRVPWEQPPPASASQQLLLQQSIASGSGASANGNPTAAPSFAQPNKNLATNNDGNNNNNPLMYDAAFRIVSSVPQGARLTLPDPNEVEPLLPELPEVFRLLRECWHASPAARPTAAEACARLESILASVRGRQRAERDRAALASAAAIASNAAVGRESAAGGGGGGTPSVAALVAAGAATPR